MKSCLRDSLTVFVEAGVNPIIIFMTAGELGIPHGSAVTPEEMAEIRTAEGEQAAEVLQAVFHTLNFPDMGLHRIPFETLVTTVLELIRKINPDLLFSFNPENQPYIDHPDHTITGMVAKYVGAATNVEKLHPEFPAPPSRPQLYLWTTHTEKTEEKIHRVPLSKKTRQQKYDYLKTVYPSQFQTKDELEWIPIFEGISRDKGQKHSERYIKIR